MHRQAPGAGMAQNVAGYAPTGAIWPDSSDRALGDRIHLASTDLYALISLSPRLSRIVIAGHHQESESSEFIMSATSGLNTSLNLMR